MSTTITKRLTLISLLLFSSASAVYAQDRTSLDQYVRSALSSNETVKQQQFQLDKSMYALKEAKSLFLPSVSLEASYTRAVGGRTIDFPIGDLLNPVYSTLNELTQSQSFPKLKNASFQLNPDDFYDAKFRTTMPLVNAEIWYNKQIKKLMISQQEAALNVYKRQLVKDVKEAYFHYYQATRAVRVYENALSLVKENIRVNESLYRNGVRNNTSLIRAQAEQERIMAELSNAESNRSNARMYFNFLLNRSFTEEIMIDSSGVGNIEDIVISPVVAQDIRQREELQQVAIAKNIYQFNKGMQQSHYIPKLNTFLDLGSQGFNWAFDDKSRYFMWGVNFQWNLFASNQYRYRTRQAEADIKATQSQEAQLQQSMQMQLEQAYNQFSAAFSNCRSVQHQVALAERYYRDQLKLYKEGQLIYVELLDAQNQLINAQLQLGVAIANTRIALAEIERNAAQYPL